MNRISPDIPTTRTHLTPKAEATRQHILDAGYALILKKGFSGIGLQEILTAADVPKGSFYHYFPSKEAFGVALLQNYVADYAHRLDRLLARPGTGRERLMRYWNAWMTDPDCDGAPGWSSGCLIVKLSAEIADLSEDMRLVLSDAAERLVARTAAIIAQASVDGSIPRQAEPQALALVLYQMWLGAALLAKLTRSDRPMQQALSATERLLACPAGA